MASVRRVRIAPKTQEYLDREQQRDPLVKKVLDGLSYRLAREPDAVGYPVREYNPPKYVVAKTYRFPVLRILRLVYSYTEREVLIEVAEVREPRDSDPG